MALAINHWIRLLGYNIRMIFPVTRNKPDGHVVTTQSANRRFPYRPFLAAAAEAAL
jgi:hypothetical protein